MRILRLNNKEVDIDEKTAIGITFQAYDLKEPGKRKVKNSNKFTIPRTAKNMALIGFAGNPQFTAQDVYGYLYFDYWVDNQQFLKHSKARIEEIEERISIFLYEKEDFWDEMKLLKWPQFVSELVLWLQTEKNLPSLTNPFIGNIGVFLYPYINATEGLILPLFFSNMYQYTEDEGVTYFEDFQNIWLKYYNNTDANVYHGGHFAVFMKTIFEFIEYKYDVNFITSGGYVAGNLWDDPYALAMYTPIRDIQVQYNYSGGVNNGFYFKYEKGVYMPHEDVQDKEDKSLYDLINSFFQHFNVIIDDVSIGDGSTDAIRLARFDDIEDLAEIVDWSGGLVDLPKFKPLIQGYGRESIIKFSSIYPDGDSLINAKILTSNNQNYDPTAELFDIDAYIPAYIAITGGVVPDLSIPEAFKTFQFFLSDGFTNDIININISEISDPPLQATAYLQKAAIYSLSGEYNFLDNVVKYPVFYEVKKWLRFNDVKDLQFFKMYYFRELNGCYFINKITGYNPELSKEPVKLELIKISDKTPSPVYTEDVYVDGLNNPFVDGLNNNFI